MYKNIVEPGVTNAEDAIEVLQIYFSKQSLIETTVRDFYSEYTNNKDAHYEKPIIATREVKNK